MTYTVYEVHAFTANGEHGNPAGVVLEAGDWSAAQMQAAAAAAGFSETAFVLPSNTATRELRFFTPTTEVDLCGHATVASWSLLHQQRLLEPGDYTQQTQAGRLGVSIMGNGLVFMEQRPAEFFETVEPEVIAPLIGCALTGFHDQLPPQIVSTGIRDLLVPVRHKDVLARLQPRLDDIAAFSRAHGLSAFHMFSLPSEGESVAVARNFAPADGINEEAATGTSNGALLCYLREHGALPDQTTYRIEQGEAMGSLSHIYGRFVDDIVWIGGAATLVKSSVINNP